MPNSTKENCKECLTKDKFGAWLKRLNLEAKKRFNKGNKMAMTLNEIFQALANGKTLINNYGKKVCTNGDTLVDEEGNTTYITFACPRDWEIYKDPKDPENWIGKLCWFWDGRKDDKFIGFLSEYTPKNESPFWRDNGFNWEHCRPLTREEVEQYLVKGE